MEQLKPYALFLGIIAATIVLAAVFSWLFRRFLKKSTIIIRNDPTNYIFLRHAITGLIYIIGFSWAVYTMPNMRAIANSLLAGAGILAVAVGFASQHALANIISGVFIIIFKPFRVNDRLKFQSGLQGVVEDISLRHVVIRDFENRRILIPNSVISEEVIINSDFGDDSICKWLELSLSYDTDLELAKSILTEEAMAHPNLLDNRSQEEKAEGVPMVRIRVIDLGESGLRLRAYLWAEDNASAFAMGCDVMERLVIRFKASGIDFGLPQRVVSMRENPDSGK
ncbi:mechanosensitive ion channel family protein [Phaeodactylibacter sp.]|jgi:small-conductance mechanosensitive channel|uniref:mechanosensitive ion channel family protein n=1 Tax=Phaeodactylibacter sp. TaxID=1940289 RepID=UPI0025EEC34B|nr:mechanosensitive ion channel family protein [Phaeodactylibacter sp.]MCI4647024.1 mechanosensitive ion channel family protein [Phaeodactylibacter sp.]MCI5092027.1 mechanosensitive ion channel family protein [Phaeodactylibacter sp.]